ncbi:hypothetical protein ACE939_05960 [Aquimarina sp. W85]|uniref:hypothetical protein n=1 Tax=Aquimarina rhodophyticola TaxID=3342246 RepID=UPI0036713D2D
MILPLTLSENDAIKANLDFTNFIEKEPVTLLLVVGTGDVAIRAVQRCTMLVNSSDIFYKGIRVIHAPNVGLIEEKILSLKINPRLKPIKAGMLDTLVMLSISNKFNNITDYISKYKFDNRPVYYIDRLIFRAMAYDKDLNGL